MKWFCTVFAFKKKGRKKDFPFSSSSQLSSKAKRTVLRAARYSCSTVCSKYMQYLWYWHGRPSEFPLADLLNTDRRDFLQRPWKEPRGVGSGGTGWGWEVENQDLKEKQNTNMYLAHRLLRTHAYTYPNTYTFLAVRDLLRVNNNRKSKPTTCCPGKKQTKPKQILWTGSSSAGDPPPGKSPRGKRKIAPKKKKGGVGGERIVTYD